MNNATNATSIKTNTQEEMEIMSAIRNSIIALAEAWESNRATKVIQMVAIAHEVDQTEVTKVVIELVERDSLELVGNRLRMFECQPVNHLVSEDPMDIVGEYEELEYELYKCDGCEGVVTEHEIVINNESVTLCEDCNDKEAGKYVEGEEELSFDEYFESSATDMVSVTHYPCMKCSNKQMDAIEFGEEFEPCEDCE